MRFGLILLAAGIVQQVVEYEDRGLISIGGALVDAGSKPVVLGALSVVLGVIAARVLDIYLLHNLGFFDVSTDLNSGLAASSGIERVADAFVTGIVIAAGAKPVADLSTRLRKVKKDGQKEKANAARAS